MAYRNKNLPELFPDMCDGPAVLADSDDLKRDEVGYTNVNLHRRINPTEEGRGKDEVFDRSYELCKTNLHSYRTTEEFYRDESDDSKDMIP